MRPIPDIKNKNIIGNNQLNFFGKSLNSFQINTPQIAATKVAPWPSPYAIAGPAWSEAIILKDIPMPHIIPPSIPMKCSLKLPSLK